jgi:hypothetical protein
MHQPQHPGLTFHQSADRREVVVADDEVAFRKTEAGPGGLGVAEDRLAVLSLTGNVRPVLLGALAAD